MNTTLATPPPGECMQSVEASPSLASTQRMNTRPEHAPPLSIALGLVIVGLIHLAIIPGFVFFGLRVGWIDTLWLPVTLDPLVTWTLASVLIALTALYFVRAALRPLGLPFGPHTWMRPMVKGAVTSLVTYVLLWPGLKPNALAFVVIPLASAAVLTASLARRTHNRGPLTEISDWIGSTRKLHSWRRRTATRVALSGTTILAVMIMMLGSWFLVPVSTPPIVDAAGHHVPGSIATMQQITLGGVDQTIVMRGTSVHNPVLLWLAGGPGGSELGWVRHYNADLEKHFVVVNWEQRAAGKDFLQLYTHSNSITPHQYVKDGLQLTNYLRQRFHQDKIYVVGHSWGTFLGVWLVQQRPQWFHAYVGVSQMVNGALNDRLWYQITLQRARQAGDTGTVKTLTGYGPPTLAWYRDNAVTLTQKIANVNFANDKFMAQDMRAHGAIGDQGNLGIAVNTPEYRPIDKLFWVAGAAFTFEKVYPQLYPVNFVTQARRLKVPVYFVEGRWDLNATPALVKQYYSALHAPHKQFVWFERSGHNVPFQEPAKFDAFLINTILRQNGH